MIRHPRCCGNPQGAQDVMGFQFIPTGGRWPGTLCGLRFLGLHRGTRIGCMASRLTNYSAVCSFLLGPEPWEASSSSGSDLRLLQCSAQAQFIVMSVAQWSTKALFCVLQGTSQVTAEATQKLSPHNPTEHFHQLNSNLSFAVCKLPGFFYIWICDFIPCPPVFSISAAL